MTAVDSARHTPPRTQKADKGNRTLDIQLGKPVGSQRTGDTLSGIVQRLLGSESKWTGIAKANPSIDPNRMRVGMKRCIPSQYFVASAAPTGALALRSPPSTGTSATTVPATM